MDNPAFNYLSVCTGGGGLDLGLRQAVPNAVCRGYVEIEAAAIALLVAHIENGSLDEAPVYNDLRRFNGRRYRGRLDGIVGGYPCQPFSFAGRRRGTDDPRHLWPYIYRLVCESEPRWCFFENVSGHLGTGYHDVVKPNLEGAGYRVAEGIFTAEEVGAPHRRERLFILAGRSGAELGDASSVGRRRQGNGGKSSIRSDRSSVPLWPPSPTDANAWARVLAVRPGLAPAIATEPGVRGVADGVAGGLGRRDKLAVLGNGVVPAQAAFAFATLAKRFM